MVAKNRKEKQNGKRHTGVDDVALDRMIRVEMKKIKLSVEPVRDLNQLPGRRILGAMC